jgi:hypothetical protein
VLIVAVDWISMWACFHYLMAVRENMDKLPLGRTTKGDVDVDCRAALGYE